MLKLRSVYVLSALASAMILSGCATMYSVSVDSITSNEPVSGKSCIVVPQNNSTSPEDLQFKEFSAYVKQALVLKGYTLSEDNQIADVSVSLDYSIGGPQQHIYSYALPVFGQTGATATTVGNAYSSTTTVSPTYGVVGAQEYTGSYVTYTMQVSLAAYDLKYFRETKQEKLLWKTNIMSTGNNGDLRFVFPIMIAAASKYISGSTGQTVNISLSGDSKEVQQIKSVNFVEYASKGDLDNKKNDMKGISINSDSKKITTRDVLKPVSEKATAQYHGMEVGSSIIIGNPDAKVTIVEFIDFQCPFCKRFHPLLLDVVNLYSGKVNYIVKYYPLPFDAMARPAIKAALAAGEQGKFSEMVNLLFQESPNFDENRFILLAQELGLNIDKFKKDYETKDSLWEQDINQDVSLGNRIDVKGTPTFFINGLKTTARDLSSFKKEIDAILGEESVVSSQSQDHKVITLTVHASKDSWIQVKVDGKIVFQRIMEKGSDENWQGDNQIELSGSNLSDLVLNVNGTLCSFNNQTKNLLITKEGLTVK